MLFGSFNISIVDERSIGIITVKKELILPLLKPKGEVTPCSRPEGYSVVRSHVDAQAVFALRLLFYHARKLHTSVILHILSTLQSTFKGPTM